MLNIPSRKLAPNQQVNHFFLHILKISTGAFEPGANLSSAEQDASFQEMHEDKSRVNFKQAGDGFSVDSVCESGYTIRFYPWNTQPPKKWIDKGFSPTHSQILFMLNSLQDKHHTCGMDKLFIPAKFLRAAFVDLESKVMIHGVC